MVAQTQRLQAALVRFRPLFDEIAAGTVTREQRHELPFVEVEKLRDAGFGRLRVPVEDGGFGLDWPSFAEVLIELATADSNLPQIFRGHIAYVEHILAASPSERRSRWIDRLVGGELVGNAWSENGAAAVGTNATRVARRPDGTWRVDGRKFYTTGSIFSEWIDATVDFDGETVTALIRRHQEGVEISDDWDGFGQPLTGTGTAVFTDASVDDDDVEPFTSRFPYQTAVYQLTLLSVLAGIAAAIERDTVAQVRARTRTYSHGSANRVSDDPQVLQIVGELTATRATARALVLDVARAVQHAADVLGTPETEDAVVAAELGSAQAQIVLTDLVPRAASRLFDTLGASAVRSGTALDRHWRNARTVSSHNPWIFKARQLGDHAVNGRTPVFVWAVGESKVPAGSASLQS
ncbi:acyl-CoA dehydrogenase family protein [Microbacterium sp. Leaf320]|uniref:acyl-CoA dehydrogenase family protein n=1 Tax=Microbacterium sp. Leaf320 TaxID=1736334 RepID=UPI0006F53A1B|nr:acyl-CoA dehydrogenase family protein [Microbacterium sp. Leaf320]KQQ65217.1 monooxygenase [Microbacterium sp. Leaf320]